MNKTKSKKMKEMKLPKDVTDRLSKEIEKEFEDEIDKLETSLDNLNLADMEKEALLIRNKFGKRLMQRIIKAKEEIVKKKS